MVSLHMVCCLAQWDVKNVIQDDCRTSKHSIIAHQIDQFLSKQRVNLREQPVRSSCGIQIMRDASPYSAAVPTYFDS